MYGTGSLQCRPIQHALMYSAQNGATINIDFPSEDSSQETIVTIKNHKGTFMFTATAVGVNATGEKVRCIYSRNGKRVTGADLSRWIKAFANV